MEPPPPVQIDDGIELVAAHVAAGTLALLLPLVADTADRRILPVHHFLHSFLKMWSSCRKNRRRLRLRMVQHPRIHAGDRVPVTTEEVVPTLLAAQECPHRRITQWHLFLAFFDFAPNALVEVLSQESGLHTLEHGSLPH